MRALIAAVLLTAAANAALAAGAVYTSRNITVHLTDKPCAGIVADLMGDEAKAMHAASVSFKGRDLQACWAMPDADRVVIVDSDGDAGYMPIDSFKDDDGI